MKKFSLVSIVASLLIAGAEPSFSQEEHSQLVGLYFLRHDGLENRYVEEVFPLALIRNGEYQQAAVSDYSDPSLSEENSPLQHFRDFRLYLDGREIGSMEVENLRRAHFKCSLYLVGTGSSDLSAGQKETLPSPDMASASGRVHGKSLSYRLQYALALADQVPQAGYELDPEALLLPTEALKNQLMDLARSYFEEYSLRRPETERSRSQPVLDDFLVFDLDNDGLLEVVGRFTQAVETESIPNRIRTDQIQIMLWGRVTEVEEPLDEILKLETFLREESAGKGFTILGVMDLDGDSVAEIILQTAGWEGTGFSIYSYEEGRLQRKFTGGGYGC